jgi:hypothetical protein
MRTLSAALISTLLTLAVVGTLLVNFGIANPMPPEPERDPPEIWVTCPIDGHTYGGNGVVLTFTVNKGPYGTYTFLSPIQYWVDGLPIGQFSDKMDSEWVPVPGTEFVSKAFSVTLTALSGGRHSLEVTTIANHTQYSQLFGYFWAVLHVSSGKIYFTIDATPPQVSTLSTQNKTYDTADVPLKFTVSEPVSWVGYSLDGKANVTITENISNVTASYGEIEIVRTNVETVLTGLLEGSHSLTLYAIDTVGNTGKSETIQFTIAHETEPKPQPQPFPTALVATAFVSVAAVSAGLLLFFLWKRNH